MMSWLSHCNINCVRMQCWNDVKVAVSLLVILFGMGSWIAINGVWVELPILVDQLPESWNLPSYMTIIIQVANIGPITITVLNLLKPGKLNEQYVVYAMVVIGSAASLLMAFFWTETSIVAGQYRSTALLTLMFFLALVDCTSSVVFLPFMHLFKQPYLTAYYIGEGFSGLVPSLVSLGQGVGKIICVNNSIFNNTSNETEYTIQGVYEPPLFPVKHFFFFVFSMMLVCGVSFILLNKLPYCKTEHVKTMPMSVYKPEEDMQMVNELSTENISSTEKVLPELNVQTFVSSNVKRMSTVNFIYFLILIAWVNALTNGVLLSIQSYACLPYGTTPYHLAVTLANIANPLACFVSFFIHVRSSLVISVVTMTGSALSAYILVLAAHSPRPPLVDTSLGAAFVVLAYVLVYFLLTFTKVAIATLFRSEGKNALLWCGAVTQFGSAIGSIAMFVIVNVYQVFQQKYPCT